MTVVTASRCAHCGRRIHLVIVPLSPSSSQPVWVHVGGRATCGYSTTSSVATPKET